MITSRKGSAKEVTMCLKYLLQLYEEESKKCSACQTDCRRALCKKKGQKLPESAEIGKKKHLVIR